MYIHKLSAIPENTQLHFGGKADSLDKLLKKRLPVPFGYAIAAEAFHNGTLCNEAEKELNSLILKLSNSHTYAVRSSAVGEDGSDNSFAGAFDTVLDVSRDKIYEAVKAVAQSSQSERIAAYTESRNTEQGKIAVVIQKYISPEFAGVLFTADAVTASTAAITGNYVKGVGEKLVSGNGCDGEFSIDAVHFSCNGPDEIKPYAQKLYSYAMKISAVYGCPQDIEWAVYKGKVYILQARPITTIYKNNYNEFLINDSLCGDYLLSKTNVGEIFLHPVSPITYSILNSITKILGIPLISNVCGQLYMNISGLCSVIVSFGFSKEKAFKMISELAGGIPENISIPVFPFDKKAFIRKILSSAKGSPSSKNNNKDFGKDFKNRIPEISNEIIDEIHQSASCHELSCLWHNSCEPFMKKTLSAIIGGLSIKPLFTARNKIESICGSELADKLLSDCSANGSIESIGTLLAVDDLIKGKISKEYYTMRYGHRHADEMELALPYPYEDPDFPENIIQEFKASGIDPYRMKAEQEKRHNEAVEQFKKEYPNKVNMLEKLLKKYTSAVYTREKIRSDALRLFCVIREFLLKAGELTGLGDDIFMLYLEEAIEYLSDNKTADSVISKRRINYENQMKMPYFPSIICGRFTPEEWKKSGCASGFYKYGESTANDCSSIIKGIAGSCGQAEGYDRVLFSIDEANSLKQGEILVVPAANIGWIKIFPKAAAIVTDIGAPLSHAVIVARELGIPAAVSCQCASGTIKTGDRISVDGTSGKVYILEKANINA
ncbi:MAG: phosphoenolpyruvate synthase [Oscillospiraceae bacterium]|nr:phosphoenolpyruvate synthase [Oscillospiraceae bacterium]